MTRTTQEWVGRAAGDWKNAPREMQAADHTFPDWAVPLADDTTVRTLRMAIPDLDEQGLLPPGIHDCSLEEIPRRFGQAQWEGRRHTRRRELLYGQLVAYLDALRGLDFVDATVVDGSFVTAKADPGDVDILVVTSTAYDIRGALRPAEYALVSRRRAKQRWPDLDPFLVRAGSTEYNDWCNEFGRAKEPPGRRKGMLRLHL
jgi:hypothetical protein